MNEIFFIIVGICHLTFVVGGHSHSMPEPTSTTYGQTNTTNNNTETEDSAESLHTQQSSKNPFNERLGNFMSKRQNKRSENIPRMLESKNMINEPNCAVTNNLCDCYTNTKDNRTQITCRYRSLQKIPEFVYNGVLYLNISLAGNRITDIHDNAFENLKVEKIDLLQNPLTNIENGAFNGLEPYLLELLLEGGGVKSQKVPFTSMIYLSRLRRLTLKNFDLGIINKTNYFRFFNDLEEMSYFDLSLKDITEDAFQSGSLPKLHSFYFDGVEFNHIPVGGLSQLKNLQKLEIRRTKITTIFSQSFKKMTNLKELILPLNEIQMMETDAFVGVSNQLTLLDLNTNQLTYQSLIALSTKEWNNLTHLSLSYNRNLRKIPEHMCMFMPNLQYLNMAQIDLRHVPKNMLTGLKNLFVLDLSWNNIQTIEDFAFMDLNNLNELMLKHQFKEPIASTSKKLELMENRFNGLEQSLESLTLEGTKTSATQLFWSTISILRELKHLNIAETGLKHIPNYAFAKNKKLRELDMDNNGITYLNQAAFRGLEHSLQDLELNFNNLTTISHCVFEYFTSLQLIHLTGNPLNCDYRIEWLHTLIHKNAHNPLFLESEFTCKTPNKYAGISLYNIPARELTCGTDACVPETCSPTTTTTTTTTKSSSKTTARITKHPTTARHPNKLELTVVSKDKHSLSIAWKVTYDTDTTGFILEYRLTTQPKEASKVINIHRSDYTHTLQNLYPGTYYYICVTAEIQQQVDVSMEDCTTEQTIAIDNGSGKLEPEVNSSFGEDRNVTIGIIIATVGVLVLIIAGVCAVVKYKIQKIKEVGRTLERMHPPYDRQYYDANKKGKCVTPNEYSDIEDAMIACKYQAQSPRNVQRQFGVDNQAFDHAEMNPYHDGTYHKVGVKKQRRKNPYENDDDDDIEDAEQVSIDTDSTVHYKSDLEMRHSAPSRLDADDLKKHYIRNLRPLPATPVEANKQRRSSTLKPLKKNKNDRTRKAVVTLATIHDNVS